MLIKKVCIFQLILFGIPSILILFVGKGELLKGQNLLSVTKSHFSTVPKQMKIHLVVILEENSPFNLSNLN